MNAFWKQTGDLGEDGFNAFAHQSLVLAFSRSISAQFLVESNYEMYYCATVIIQLYQ